MFTLDPLLSRRSETCVAFPKMAATKSSLISLSISVFSLNMRLAILLVMSSCACSPLVTVVFGYYGFWHSSLYLIGMAKRPFNPNRVYRNSKVLHNMWYTFLGVVQFTIWEVVYMYCCATKRIRYLSDHQVMSSYWNLVMFCLVAFWVPLYKDFHFYFTHR